MIYSEQNEALKETDLPCQRSRVSLGEDSLVPRIDE